MCVMYPLGSAVFQWLESGFSFQMSLKEVNSNMHSFGSDAACNLEGYQELKLLN